MWIQSCLSNNSQSIKTRSSRNNQVMSVFGNCANLKCCSSAVCQQQQRWKCKSWSRKRYTNCCAGAIKASTSNVDFISDKTKERIGDGIVLPLAEGNEWDSGALGGPIVRYL